MIHASKCDETEQNHITNPSLIRRSSHLSRKDPEERKLLARLTNLRFCIKERFILSNNQIYQKPIVLKNGREQAMRYSVCENDVFAIMTRLHRSSAHAGKSIIS